MRWTSNQKKPVSIRHICSEVEVPIVTTGSQGKESSAEQSELWLIGAGFPDPFKMTKEAYSILKNETRICIIPKLLYSRQILTATDFTLT